MRRPGRCLVLLVVWRVGRQLGSGVFLTEEGGLSRLRLFLFSLLRGRFFFLDFRNYERLFGKNFFLNFRRDFWKNWSSGCGYFLYDPGDSLTCGSCSGGVLSMSQGTAAVAGYSGLLFALNNITWHGDNVAGDTDVTMNDELASLVDRLRETGAVYYCL